MEKILDGNLYKVKKEITVSKMGEKKVQHLEKGEG